MPLLPIEGSDTTCTLLSTLFPRSHRSLRRTLQAPWLGLAWDPREAHTYQFPHLQ